MLHTTRLTEKKMAKLYLKTIALVVLVCLTALLRLHLLTFSLPLPNFLFEHWKMALRYLVHPIHSNSLDTIEFRTLVMEMYNIDV